MMYKSLNDLAPQYLSDLFVRLSDFHTRDLRNTKNDLAVPLMRTVSGQKAFSYRGGTSLTTISKRPPRYTLLNQDWDSWGTKIFNFVLSLLSSDVYILCNLFVNSLVDTLILTGPNCKTKTY